MLSRFRYLKIMASLAAFFALVQCTNVVRTGARPLQSPYTMSADAYIALANNHLGEEKQALLLLAAGRLVDEGEWQQAKSILTQVTPESALQSDKKALLLAKINLAKKQPKSALKLLASIHHPEQLPTYEQAQFHEALAHSYQSLGKPLESVNERIKLDQILPDEGSRENNRRTLWLSLTTLPGAELNTLAVEAPQGSVLRGWAELALIARKNPAYPQKMLAKLQTWQQTYPNHPARALLPQSLEMMQGHLYNRPKQIALLLPLSGPLAGPGEAIQDGFMAALRERQATTKTTLRFYDTNRMSATNAYQRAISDGADYVIGPLSKPNVATVAAMQHPVPTLLLNNVDARTQDNAYQFGLSPPNEARQVAVKARRAGLSRALVIAPTGSFGDETLTAFSQKWRVLRGQVVDTLRFDPAETEQLNENIRELLQAVPDDERKKQLKAMAKDPTLKQGPLRREDFDVVFLLAYPSSARQIMPLLRYYYAGRVPVYATSSVYTGTQNTMADRDLDNIIFCDMPWVFKNPGAKTRDWPEGFNSYTRLYALGMDSYALGTELNSLLLFPALGTDNQTGALYLSQDHRISRILPFGQFKGGIANRL
ncbi:MAG: penicillin-binding protein activator [Legionellaceae bacterium]|nr:penicillin-binding protein activator [Legionellaceae bacterium]